ncbi:MAG: Asp-tRNA(Asn)/Glu-tRNA(Gln) amidotransferase subunit GatC [Chloroflexi bacterium]|nr:Asp-tRNA(Asn)/Glu-tRNA(Gln) amidotransferase subunit GatC [Chloroflexota bacterium]
MTSPRLSQDEVQHIALIYRLGLSQEEIESLRHQLSDILENFQVLDQVDTSGVPPTGHSVALENVMREDVAAPPMSKEDTLANAPLREDNYFRVKAVLD